MNDQEFQKLTERVEKSIEMNQTMLSSLLEEMRKLKVGHERLAAENRRWREHYENGSQIYKRTQQQRQQHPVHS
jgi:hypothetical protein